MTTISMRWDGEALYPLRRFAKLADQVFVIGEDYEMAEAQDRTRKTHNHYFAAVHNAWVNLPEAVCDRFPTEEHLRKWALIKAGYRDERSIVCASKAEAVRVKGFVRPMDDYAVVLSSEAVVTVYTAKSQSMRAMGKHDFQASKQAVLDVLSGLIGVDVATLRKQAA